MSPEIFPYIVILIPLLIIVGLSLFFYRLFTKSAKKDRDYTNKLKELEELKKLAEYRNARIISVQPQQTSLYSPGLKTVNIRFEIEETPGKFKMLSALWQLDDYYSSNFQAGDNIQIKVYDEYVFSTHDGVKLLP
jgi:hypothetical protein